VYQTLLVSKPSGAAGLDYGKVQVNGMRNERKVQYVPSVSVRGQ
jgi:hypothetical protein